jgi:hypothetical protein
VTGRPRSRSTWRRCTPWHRSNSWDEDLFDTTGNETTANIDAFTQVFEQGATEGIGFYFSSGDCSTEDPAIVANGLNCDTTSSEPQVGFPPALLRRLQRRHRRRLAEHRLPGLVLQVAVRNID